jgi:hypothetical protein
MKSLIILSVVSLSPKTSLATSKGHFAPLIQKIISNFPKFSFFLPVFYVDMEIRVILYIKILKNSLILDLNLQGLTLVDTGEKEEAAPGFEPGNNGFARSNQKMLKYSNSKDLQQCQKQTDTKTDNLPQDLQNLINAWPDLPLNIKNAIGEIIKSY